MIYLAIACFALLFYSYVGYPVLVSLLATTRPKRWKIDETYRPTVSIILPAHNEERVIRRCLESLVQLEYPQDKLEILVGSDGSTDRTNDILREIGAQYPFVKPFLYTKNRGKMMTVNELVSHARNEILMFVDADVTLNPHAILSQVRHYADASVGGVAGCLRISGDQSNGAFKSESTFLSFESNLRRNEAAIFSTVGLYGGNYSVRRELWKPIPGARVSDDFFAVLTINTSGHRLLYEENAVSTELYGRNYSEEFSRKRRWVPECLSALRIVPSSLFKGRQATMVWPHKILRWATGFLMLGMLIGSIGAYAQGYAWLSPVLMFEFAFAALVVIGSLASALRIRLPIAASAFWFVYMNIAFGLGILAFLFKRKDQKWKQTTRISDVPAHAVTPEVSRS
jgi:biofilm PGA synthesis N-glycosyltransferase PgaC